MVSGILLFLATLRNNFNQLLGHDSKAGGAHKAVLTSQGMRNPGNNEKNRAGSQKREVGSGFVGFEGAEETPQLASGDFVLRFNSW